jgi:tetratricopeptide (TPR) repeat protein
MDLSPADYVQRLTNARQRLQLIEASLSLSYELLSAEMQKLWRMLVVFPATFDRSAAAAVWSLDPNPTQDALSALVVYSLVEWNAVTARYRLHDLARDYAAALLEEAGEVDEAEQNHLAYYLAFAQAHSQEDPNTWDRLEEELPNLLLAAKRAAKTMNSAAMVSFEEALIHESWFMIIRGYYQKAVDLLSQSLTVQESLGEQQNKPRTLNKLAYFYIRLGQYEEAQKRAKEARRLADALDDQEQQADSLHYLGMVFDGRGENKLALDVFKKELEIRQELDNPSRLANCLNSLGAIQEFLGNYAEAKRYFNEALTIYNKVGDQAGIAMCIANILSLYMGDYTDAMNDFETALNRSKELNDREGIAQNLFNKGLLQSYVGDHSLSLRSLQESLSLCQEMGHKSGEALNLSALAEVHSALGDYQQAVKYLQTAGGQLLEIGDKDVEIQYLNMLGAVHHELGDYEKALEDYEALTNEVGSGYFLAQSKLGLARTCIARGKEEDLEKARHYAAEAINLCRELQLASNEPRGHAYLGKANLLLGGKETALQNCREAMRLLDKQKHVHGSEAEIYLNTIEVLAANGLEDERRQYLERAYDLVQATAAKSEDEALRQSYLAVPVNREILETWERDCADKTP